MTRGVFRFVQEFVVVESMDLEGERVVVDADRHVFQRNIVAPS